MSFLRRYILTPPVIFPIGVILYFFMAVYNVVLASEDPSASFPMWASAAWLLLMAILCCGLCALKKWAATTFIILATATILTYYGLPEHHILRAATTDVFPVDVVISAMVLFFYRRFT